MLPFFSRTRVAGYESATRQLCRDLIQDTEGRDQIDAADGYAKKIPVAVISLVLGVGAESSETFTHWVREIVEFGDDAQRREAALADPAAFMSDLMKHRRKDPGSDLVSHLIAGEHDGQTLSDTLVLGISAIILIAGVDTTWSAIGSALWHFATHQEDQQRLRSDPSLYDTAMEEILRAYSPVTMGRITTEDLDYHDCLFEKGDRVLLNFPSANRDSAKFSEANQIVLDRQINPHIAFGSGIHRCAGSNLARMELRVAVEEWIRGVGPYGLDAEHTVQWAGGQVRGPRVLKVRRL